MKNMKKAKLTTIFIAVLFVTMLAATSIAYAIPDATIYGSSYEGKMGDVNNSTEYSYSTNMVYATPNAAMFEVEKTAARNAITTFYSVSSSSGKVSAHIRNNNNLSKDTKTADIYYDSYYRATVEAKITSPLATVAHTCHYSSNVKGANNTALTFNVYYGDESET